MLWISLCLMSCLGFQEPAVPAAPQVSVETWSGYLYRDAKGQVQVGWPVVAMGVMARGDHVLGGELATRLAPFVSAIKDDYFFWNYELEEPGPLSERSLPRALVTVRGNVAKDPSLAAEDQLGFGSSGAPKTMTDARLLEFECIDEQWLEAWALFFRDEASPFRIAQGSVEIDEPPQRFATAALANLRKMRQVPAPSAEQLAPWRAIAKDATHRARLRQSTEMQIQRWLVGGVAKQEFELGDLSDLPPLPPSSIEIQRAFLESETRSAFLEAIQKLWPGDLTQLTLVHYQSNGRSTWYESTTLDLIAAEWDETVYAQRLAATKSMLKR